jgi:hypothetical protein
VRAILEHGGKGLVDCVILNNGKFAPEVEARYQAQGAYPVRGDAGELEKMGLRCIADNILEQHGKVRHNGRRLAALLLREFIAKRPQGQRSRSARERLTAPPLQRRVAHTTAVPS